MVPTVPWGLVGGCGVPCAHQATTGLSSWGLFWTKGAMSSVFFQQGFCTEARCYPKRRSPNLERRCSICSTVPRLTACPLLMVVTLLWLLPWSALGIQSQYPSRTPWYSASRCVFDLACWLRVWLQWVLSTWAATTNWWAICLRAQGLVGRRTHTSDLAADCQQPLSLPNTMVADRLYGGARVTPGFFCCHQVYSEVERDLSQCIGSSTRTPHWQFLLENRDEKSSGSGSQKLGTLTFYAPWWLYAKQ